MSSTYRLGAIALRGLCFSPLQFKLMKTKKEAIKEAFLNGSMLTTPANGEKLQFEIGEDVIYTNDYGVKFEAKVLGYTPENNSLYKYGSRYFLDKESYWYPVKEAALSRPVIAAITISPSNPLDRQCKELTGDGYNSFDWEGDLNADPIVIKHLKTGLIVKVL